MGAGGSGGATRRLARRTAGLLRHLRLDRSYGRLLDALERVGELENTIVVYTADHGSHFRARNAEYKRSCHDSSIRVPGFARGPGFQDGGTVEELVNLIDLPVTLLEAAGIDVPDRMEGDGLLPLLDDGRDVDDWRRRRSSNR